MFICQSLGVQERRRLYSSWSIECLFARARPSRRDEGCILHEVYDVYLPEPGRPGGTKVVFFMKYRMFICQSLGVQERRRLYSSWSIWCLFTRAWASWETKVVFFMKYIMFIYQSPGVQERRRLYSSWSIGCLFTRAWASRRDEGCILHEVYDVYLPEPGRPGETKVVFFMKYRMLPTSLKGWATVFYENASGMSQGRVKTQEATWRVTKCSASKYDIHQMVIDNIHFLKKKAWRNTWIAPESDEQFQDILRETCTSLTTSSHMHARLICYYYICRSATVTAHRHQVAAQTRRKAVFPRQERKLPSHDRRQQAPGQPEWPLPRSVISRSPGQRSTWTTYSQVSDI